MNSSNIIKELVATPILNMEQIQIWLLENRSKYYNSIELSSCRKWEKCITLNEKPFPCVCPKRYSDCIFIEVYYELEKLLLLHTIQSGSQGPASHSNDLERDILQKIPFLNVNDLGNIELKIYNPICEESVLLNIAKDDFKKILEMKESLEKKTN